MHQAARPTVLDWLFMLAVIGGIIAFAIDAQVAIEVLVIAGSGWLVYHFRHYGERHE